MRDPREQGVDFPAPIRPSPNESQTPVDPDAEHVSLERGGLDLVGPEPGSLKARLGVTESPVDLPRVGTQHPHVIYTHVARELARLVKNSGGPAVAEPSRGRQLAGL